MTAVYRQRGVSVQYPENWSLEEQVGEPRWGISVQSPRTAFWSLLVDEEGPPAQEMADKALESLRSEYPLLDSSTTRERIGDRDLAGHDVEFICMDLPVTARIRAFRNGHRTLLLLCQAEDADWQAYEAVLSAISAGLRCEA